MLAGLEGCWVWDRSAGQGGDLDEVVGEDGLSGPDPGPVEAVEAGAVPAVAAVEVADPALTAGAPLHDLAEGRAVLDGPSRLGGFALARNDDAPDSEVVQVVLDTGLAVAVVAGDRAQDPAGEGDHPHHDGGVFRRVRRKAL